MGKCKDCGAPALEGEEYCESCLLLRDLGLIDDSEPSEGGDRQDSFDAPDNAEDIDNIASDLNIDEDIMSLLNMSDETQDLTDEDIIRINEELEPSKEMPSETDEDMLSFLDEPVNEDEPAAVLDENILSLLDESNDEEKGISTSEDDILSLSEESGTENDAQGITDDDILSLIDAPLSENEVAGITDDDILGLVDETSSESEAGGITDDDIMSLLNESSSEGEPASITDDDIMSLLEDTMTEETEETTNLISDEDIMALGEPSMSDSEKSSDMGDILSDALGVLNDSKMDEMEKHLKELMPEDEKTVTEEEVKSTKGLFKKLFGNVPGSAPDPDAPTEEELEEKRKAEKEQAKAAKKEEQKQLKEAKKKAAEEKKAAKKAEKQRLKEEAALNEPVDNGRINKAGSSIIIGLAACLAATILIGTNTFTYANDVSSAKDYFSKKQYTKAYQQVAGIKIKKKDKNTYNKIATVMYVNKEFDSYNNFYNMEMYPQSLDSLIRGLKRYDQCKEDASELNVMNDLNHVKSNIVHSLKDSFNLNENEVQYLMSMDSQDKYSKEIVKLAKAS